MCAAWLVFQPLPPKVRWMKHWVHVCEISTDTEGLQSFFLLSLTHTPHMQTEVKRHYGNVCYGTSTICSPFTKKESDIFTSFNIWTHNSLFFPDMRPPSKTAWKYKCNILPHTLTVSYFWEHFLVAISKSDNLPATSFPEDLITRQESGTSTCKMQKVLLTFTITGIDGYL